jgi:hypothetical protein
MNASAIGLPEEIIVSTRNPCSFLSFSWDGDVKGASLLSDISFILDAKDCEYCICFLTLQRSLKYLVHLTLLCLDLLRNMEKHTLQLER